MRKHRHSTKRTQENSGDKAASVDVQRLLIPVHRLRTAPDGKTKGRQGAKEKALRDCFRNLRAQIEFILDSTRAIIDETQTTRAYIETLENILEYTRYVDDENDV